MPSPIPYSFFPLSESAVLLNFEEVMNEAVNRQVLAVFHFLQKKKLPFVTGLVPAYASLTVHYHNLFVQQANTEGLSGFDVVVQQLEKALEEMEEEEKEEGRLMRIPVCYEEPFATDIRFLAEQNGLTTSEVVALHTAALYRVYMIGFLPGFAYMGEVDAKIAIPRKQKPLMVAAGSVGIAGNQTGIYPLESPGGWQIIGRTPLSLFRASQPDPVLLKPGDSIQFYPITAYEFAHY